MNTLEKTKENATSKANFRVPILDGLRGIAILMVLWFHVWQLSWLGPSINLFGSNIYLDFIPATGYMGVDLFFFLSAFCLFYPYARHIFEGVELQSIRKFTYKRAIKIVPSYLLAITSILVFGKFLTGDIQALSSLEAFTKSLLAHLTFTHNFFHSTKDSINGVFWSLSVEVQFYIIFPFICYCFRRRPFITYIVMVSISLVYRYVIKTNYDFHFLLNQVPGFLDIFASGMLGAWLLVFLRNRVDLTNKLRPLFTFLGIGFFCILILMLKNLYQFGFLPSGIQIWQSDNRLYISFVFLCITVFSSLSYSFWIKILSNKLLVFFSTISYNLYIYHQLISREFLNRKIPLYITEDPHNDPVWQIQFTIISVVVSIIFTSIITFGFEIPMLKNGFLHFFPKRLKLMFGKKKV